MKKVFRVILMAMIAIASVSCMALHKVTMLPSTSLERNNYTYVRNIRAQINYTYIFGIGGLRNKDVIEKLTDAANLLPGEALANVSVQRRVKCFLGIVVLSEYEATGQVVRFTDGVINEEKAATLRKFEELSLTASGYDGDFLSALPVSAVNVKLEKQAENSMVRYGVSLTPGQITETISTTLNRNKKYGVQKITNNTMDVVVLRCDMDANIYGYAEIKDIEGNIIATTLFNGSADRSVLNTNKQFLEAFKNATERLYVKWYNLYVSSTDNGEKKNRFFSKPVLKEEPGKYAF